MRRNIQYEQSNKWNKMKQQELEREMRIMKIKYATEKAYYQNWNRTLWFLSLIQSLFILYLIIHK